MKKCFLLMASVLLLVVISAITVYAQDDTFTAYCEHCKADVTWTALTSSTQSMAAGGHYYLPENRTMTAQTIADGKTVCIDLNNFRYISNKRIYVKSGGTLHIQGAGKFWARGNGTINYGGAIYVEEGAQLQMNNVTVDYQYYEGRNTASGGIIANFGSAVLNNCTVANGRATELGGNIYVGTTGVLTLNNTAVTGGRIVDDTAHNARCVYSLGQVQLSGSSSIELLRIGSATELADAVTLTDGYTGSLNLHFDSDLESGTDIGNLSVAGADVSGGQIVITNVPLEVYFNGTNLVAGASPAAQVNGVRFATLEEALEAAGEYPLELCQDAASITATKDMTLDLAGFSVETLTAAEGVTVSVIDSQTADYDIEDGAYGKVGTISGNVVAGTDADNSYIVISEEDGTSYHALRMAVDTVTLRTRSASVYFNADFMGDSKVQALIDTFGVAFSLEGAPDAATFENEGTYTVFSQDQFNSDEVITSSLVTGILKDSNDLATNTLNATTVIYGVPYIRYADGTTQMGDTQCISLMGILKALEDRWTDLSMAAQDDVMDMYLNYEGIMGNWELPVIRPATEEREEDIIRILSIGNSHGNDANWFLREVFLQQDPDRRVVVGILYYSGCSIEQHVEFAANNSPEYIYHKNVDGTWVSQADATLLDGLQDERWDIVMLQEVSYDLGVEATFQNDNLQTLIDYVKANVKGEPVLGFNPEFTSPMTPTYYEKETAQTAVPSTWVTKHTERYNMDQMYMYDCMISNLHKYVLTNEDIDPNYVLPGVTAVQYARNALGMTDLDLYRDYAHLSEMARLMVSYLWYCQLTGETLDSIDDMLVDEIPQHLRHKRFTSEGVLTITDAMKEIILESVNYALENPYEVPDPIEQEDPGEDDVINVLMIGNSFCNYYPDELKAMADAAGKQLEVYNVYYGGCKLSQHYKFLKNDMPVYSFKKNGVRLYSDVSLWFCISQGNWDYISLQEGSSVLRDAASAQAGWDSNIKYFSHMYEWLKQRCPESQIIWHQTWAYQVGTTSGGYVTADAAQQAAYHERLYTYAEMITERYPDLLLVNSGDAWAILREGGYDKLCNRLGKAVTGAEPHTGDNYHEGDIGGGQYLNACVWYEVLFGESCIGNTFVPNYTYGGETMDMLITLDELQQAAHQAVTERNAE